MDSQVEELMPLVLGKGVQLRLFIDHDQPTDSPDHNWSETTYDGKEDSEVITVPNHWHQNHDEIIKILEGKMIIRVEGKEHVASAGDAPTVILRGEVHGFSFIKGEPVRVQECTIPSGTFKAEFFQDMLQGHGAPSFFLVMRAFYDGDAYVALPGGFKLLDYLFVTILGFIAKAFVPAKPLRLKKKGEELTTDTTVAGGFFK